MFIWIKDAYYIEDEESRSLVATLDNRATLTV
jgi:hypothetical protein